MHSLPVSFALAVPGNWIACSAVARFPRIKYVISDDRNIPERRGDANDSPLPVVQSGHGTERLEFVV